MKNRYTKKFTSVIIAFSLLLTSCGQAALGTSAPKEDKPEDILSSEKAIYGPIFTPETSLPPAVEEEEMDLHKLLYHQVRYYETGSSGRPFDINEQTDSAPWMALGVFAEEAGVPYGIDSGRQELLTLMAREWLDFDVPEGYYFSDVSAGQPNIDLTVYPPEIDGDTASVRVSRVYDGHELYDSRYVFKKIPASEEVLNSVASVLTIDGSIWRYESVSWIEEDVAPLAPITIATADELIALCRRINRHEADAANGHFVLGNDIDLTNCYWEPMGTRLDHDEDWTASYAAAKVPGGFNGIFDGAGHTISGLSLTMDSEWAEVGFFGRIGPNAKVMNLTVEGSVSDLGATETQNGSVGGFAGVICPGAEVTNCHFNGKVKGYAYTGGFVGRVISKYTSNDKVAVIKNCTSNAAVTACLQSGGFAGAVFADSLEGCDAMGSFTIEIMGQTIPTVIGGFAGSVVGDLINCRSAVMVDYHIDGANMMGNFIGELAIKDTRITGCVVDPNFLHDGWYLVGMKWHKDITTDIEKVEWLKSKADLV